MHGDGIGTDGIAKASDGIIKNEVEVPFLSGER
jgi:hypothetical protein